MDETGSQFPTIESPIRDLESLKREMMIMEEDTESLDESIEEKEDLEIVLNKDSEGNATRPSALEDVNQSDEEDDGYGWKPWRGPWVRRAIGLAG